MSVRVKLAGGWAWTPHVRTFDEIRARPHIARSHGMWGVFYLLGKQSRIRCNLYDKLVDAQAQARMIYRLNKQRQL